MISGGNVDFLLTFTGIVTSELYGAVRQDDKYCVWEAHTDWSTKTNGTKTAHNTPCAYTHTHTHADSFMVMG